MGLKMVNAHYRNRQGVTKRRSDRRTDKEGTCEPRPLGVGDAAQVAGSITMLRQQGLDHRQQAPDVVARSQLRHHAAIFGVQRHLRMHMVPEQPRSGLVQGDAGLVAGAFDSQNKHVLRLQQPGPLWFANQAIIVRMRAFHETLRKRRESLLFMPTIRVKENEPFEVALRRFKRTVEKTGLLTELRAREFYEKPTTERKRKLAAAVKRHHKRLRSQVLPPRMY